MIYKLINNENAAGYGAGCHFVNTVLFFFEAGVKHLKFKLIEIAAGNLFNAFS